MSRLRLGWALAAASLLVWCSGGCSRFPAPPEKPEINPGKAGKAAISEYDANGDGKLDAEELKKCPSLEIAKQRIDSDRDGMLTAEEITARINYWLNCGTTIMSGSARITLGGRPLQGATVTFDPEEFLGPGFAACEGVSDSLGQAFVQGSDAKFPGIYLGLYRVRVSKLDKNGQETIPARYNTQTELGFEATDDIPGIGEIVFHLKSK